jgi:protein-tyrosine-phosphatase
VGKIPPQAGLEVPPFMNHRIVPIRERFRKRKRLVLFICTGNTCRSPMATGYLRHLLTERGIKDVETRSAGVMTITGLLASQEAVQVMQAEEIDITRHRSTQLTSELIHKADLILSMTPFHRQTALRVSEAARPKTFLLKEFTRSDLKNAQIGDPMGCTLEVFKKCFKEIKTACAILVEHDFILGKAEIPKPMSAEQSAALRSEAKKKSARKPLPKPKAAPAKKAAPAAAKPAAAPAKPAASAKPASGPSKPAASVKPAAPAKPAAAKPTTPAVKGAGKGFQAVKARPRGGAGPFPAMC